MNPVPTETIGNINSQNSDYKLFWTDAMNRVPTETIGNSDKSIRYYGSWNN